jgi:hypothetical protein
MHGLAMAHRSRAFLRRHFVWLLWLALLLPAAQAAASWHALSHALPDAGSAGDTKRAPQLHHCDLCLTAASISGGAPAGEPPSLKPVALRHELPRFAHLTLWDASPARPYLSRAPPLASR